MILTPPLHVFDVAGKPATTPIMIQPNGFQDAPIHVELRADVVQLCPAGWPAPPPQPNGATAWPFSPGTVIPAGTTQTMWACEAAALVAAGAAALA